MFIIQDASFTTWRMFFLHPGVPDPNLALFTSTTLLLEKLVIVRGEKKSFSLAMVGQIDEPNYKRFICRTRLLAA